MREKHMSQEPLHPLPVFPDLRGARVLVVGLGISGASAARFLAGKGARVTVSDRRPEAELDPRVCADLHARDVTLETGEHREETFFEAEVIVVSPGVPHDRGPVGRARDRGIRVIGELELASRYCTTPILAVTGTNGKSTVTTHLGELLEAAGYRVFTGGNLGTPFIGHVDNGAPVDLVVLEVSSFQLDTIEGFRPLVSVILNITPDHLDRYPSLEAYATSKLRITGNQGPEDFVILNDEDPRLQSLSLPGGPRPLRYGSAPEPWRHAFYEGETLRAGLDLQERIFLSAEAFPLKGRHNRENLLALALAGLAVGIAAPVLQRCIAGFKPLPHRMEAVGSHRGVHFVDDSKATNLDAAIKAIEAFDQPILLVAGGRHKGADYGPLVAASRGRVKAGVFLGEARGLLAEACGDIVPHVLVEDMEEAVRACVAMAAPGDVVLLAPACSSFDMFSDYAHRGRAFQEAVRRLGDA